MHDDDRMFHDARDAVEFSLGRAFAGIEEARATRPTGHARRRPQ